MLMYPMCSNNGDGSSDNDGDICSSSNDGSSDNDNGYGDKG